MQDEEGEWIRKENVGGGGGGGGKGFVAECGFQRSQLLDASRGKETKKGAPDISM